MIVWARKFKQAIERETVNLPAYILLLLLIDVDDGNMAARALPLGSRLIDSKIEIVKSEIEKDSEIPVDIRTSEIFLQIANSGSTRAVLSQMTARMPSANTSKSNTLRGCWTRQPSHLRWREHSGPV